MTKFSLNKKFSFFKVSSSEKKTSSNITVDENLNQNASWFQSMEPINYARKKSLKLHEIEDFVLNDRIDGVKKFKVNATPTIIINDEKFEKTLNYKNLKKALEKLI